jgi:hypothetical protein
VPRVLHEPSPTAYLAGFRPDGINLELRFLIEHAATGTSAVRSTVNRNIPSPASQCIRAMRSNERRSRARGGAHADTDDR